VAGEAVDIDTEGEFRTTVDLELGPNEVRVEVTDEAGNANWTTLHIERVREPDGAGDGLGPVPIAAIAVALVAVLGIAFVILHRRGKVEPVDESADAPGPGAPATPEGARGDPEEGTEDPSEWEEY
jgi:hypothetical protein